MTSREEFSLMMEGRDVPIDSNVFLYSGNISRVLTIQDVYRPAPHFQLRQGVRHSLNPPFEPPEVEVEVKVAGDDGLLEVHDLRGVGGEPGAGGLSSEQAGAEDGPHWGGDEGHLRDGAALLPDPARR